MKRRKRKRRPVPRKPEFSEGQILAWADTFYANAGRWPTAKSGRIPESLGEKWIHVETALRKGHRGLPGGSSLARLLAERRGVRNIASLPPLRVQQILAWADAHHRRFKEWPTRFSGGIADAPGETWSAVNSALVNGRRRLPGGSSLPRLLASHRGVRNPKDLPGLTIKQILAWADGFYKRTGDWPTKEDGEIPGTAGEKWPSVDDALRKGSRGLAATSSLALLLAEHRGARNHLALQPYTIERILEWADGHLRRFAKWPTTTSGPIADAPGETWLAVQHALHDGGRGLPGGSSLARLLAQRRGRLNHLALPHLTVEQILAWADEHHCRTGKWPSCHSGPVIAAPGETWMKVHTALYNGGRGLPGGSSLILLLAERRGARNMGELPKLNIRSIVAWADDHFQRSGSWPKHMSGPIHTAPGETWAAVESGLRGGFRGLPGGSSLYRVLKRYHRIGKGISRRSMTEIKRE